MNLESNLLQNELFPEDLVFTSSVSKVCCLSNCCSTWDELSTASDGITLLSSIFFHILIVAKGVIQVTLMSLYDNLCLSPNAYLSHISVIVNDSSLPLFFFLLACWFHLLCNLWVVLHILNIILSNLWMKTLI